MIVLGVILIVIGFVIGIPVLYTIGIVLAVAGVALAILGSTGRRVGGRAHWF
jgi:VIT1/CCC1 family predicted Fe2+/Mn2+ transporter